MSNCINWTSSRSPCSSKSSRTQGRIGYAVTKPIEEYNIRTESSQAVLNGLTGSVISAARASANALNRRKYSAPSGSNSAFPKQKGDAFECSDHSKNSVVPYQFIQVPPSTLTPNLRRCNNSLQRLCGYTRWGFPHFLHAP